MNILSNYLFVELSIYYHHEKYLNYRLWFYFFTILIAGLVNDFVFATNLLPKSAIVFIDTYLKTSTRNVLNLYFVKLGWAWTLFPLFCLVLFTRIFYVKRSIAKAVELASKSSKRKKSVHFREPVEELAGDAPTNKAHDDTAEEISDDHIDAEGAL